MSVIVVEALHYLLNLLLVDKRQQSSLEIAESLEQLRWLQNGYKIKVGLTEHETIGIDTPADLERANKFLESSNLPK